MTWSSRHTFLGLPSSKFISFLNIINLNIQIAQLITQCLFDVLRTFLSVDSFFLSEERKDDGWLLLQTSCSRRAHNKCSCAVCNYATFIAWAHHIKMFKILIVVSEQNWLQWRRQQAAVVSFDRLWNIKLTLSHKSNIHFNFFIDNLVKPWLAQELANEGIFLCFHFGSLPPTHSIYT